MTKKGFTLIEVLVYIAVSSLIISAVSAFFLWSNKSHAKAKAIREVLAESQRIMETIGYELKHARSIYSPTSDFSSDTGQLSLETTNYKQANESVGYIDFFICENKLCLKKEGQNPVIMSSDNVKIDKIRFYQVNNTTTTDSVQVSLELSYVTPSEKQEHQASINTTSTFSVRQ